MKLIARIAAYNIAAILVYSILVRLAIMGESESIIFVSAPIVGLHFFVCLIVGASLQSKKDLSRAWLLSALVVALIGFSTCLGNATL